MAEYPGLPPDAGQDVHVVASLRYSPAEQAAQAAVPTAAAAEFQTCAVFVHSQPSLALFLVAESPQLMQALASVEPAAEYAVPLQSVHTLLPFSYLPAGQTVQPFLSVSSELPAAQTLQ